MTSKGAIDVRFYYSDKLIAEKAWHVLPALDEVVMLRKDKADRNLSAFNVKGRVFVGEGAPHNRQTVFIYLEDMNDATGRRETEG